jgi:DNA-binding MarR family transcriptional regulator
LPELSCACANLRRAARAVTRLYDRELSPAGLELSQLTLLMTLDQTAEITQKALARLLAMDSTTLTRTLRPMLERGWIAATAGEDRRQKLLSLTPTPGDGEPGRCAELSPAFPQECLTPPI